MIVVIDYDMGNLKSIANAFKALGLPVEISGEPEALARADGIVLPGVGAFGDGMKNLERRGLLPVLHDKVVRDKTPYLGVCLGMQFLAELGLEHGEHQGLGWIPGSCVRIQPKDPALKVPHMGWNDLNLTRPDSPLLREVADGTAFYFVHSYHFVPADPACVIATADHGGPLTAAVQQEHIFGVQFHPEKSQGAGLKLLRNFADLVAARA